MAIGQPSAWTQPSTPTYAVAIYAGLVETGLYQLNLTVPTLPDGDAQLPLVARNVCGAISFIFSLPSLTMRVLAAFMYRESVPMTSSEPSLTTMIVDIY